MIFWVKYGFENTPAKMYNANVSCAILLSFVRNTCAREIEDYCKHKHIQLGIELDALHKVLQQTRRGLASAGNSSSSSSGALSTTRSTASSAESLPSAAASTPTATRSRPPSGASRPTTPGTTRASARGAAAAATGAVSEDQNEEVAAALAQIEVLEKQLAVVDTAARYAKELATGLLHVDLADKHGAPLHLDQAGAARASTLVALREHYSVVAISTGETGESRATPLVFKLHA